LTYLEQNNSYNSFLLNTNWSDVGVGAEYLDKWWQEHKEADIIRREYEESARERRKIKKRVLDKKLQERIAFLEQDYNNRQERNKAILESLTDKGLI
jgi:hypothetical protein